MPLRKSLGNRGPEDFLADGSTVVAREHTYRDVNLGCTPEPLKRALGANEVSLAPSIYVQLKRMIADALGRYVSDEDDE